MGYCLNIILHGLTNEEILVVVYLRLRYSSKITFNDFQIFQKSKIARFMAFVEIGFVYTKYLDNLSTALSQAVRSLQNCFAT